MKNDEYMNNNQEPSLFDDGNEPQIKDGETDELSEYNEDLTDATAVLDGTSTVFVPDIYDTNTSDDQDEDYDADEDDEDGNEDISTDDNGESSESDAKENEASEQISLEEEENEKALAKAEEKPRKIDSIFDFVELFVFTLAAVFIITSFFFRYSTVSGGSMQNTLQHGETLLLRSFLYTPKAGDIVVVHDQSVDFNERKDEEDPVVKRVIAVAGQTVKFTEDTVYVDGVALEEDYVYTGDYFDFKTGSSDYKYDLKKLAESEPLQDDLIGYQEGVYFEVLVPEGKIFVMGDHRNNSMDSRSVGMMHEDAVIGKVVLRLFPFDKFGKVE